MKENTGESKHWGNETPVKRKAGETKPAKGDPVKENTGEKDLYQIKQQESLKGEGGQVNEDQKVEIRSSCGLVISCTGGGGAGNRGRVSCDPSATKTSTFSSR